MSAVAGIVAVLASVLALVLGYLHTLRRGERQGAHRERGRIDHEARKEQDRLKQAALDEHMAADELADHELADRLRAQAKRLRRR